MEKPAVETIVRFLSNDLSEEDQKQIRIWIAQHPDNEKEFNRIADLWALHKKNPQFAVNTTHDWNLIKERIERQKPVLVLPGFRQLHWVYKVAAVLVLSLSIWIFQSESITATEQTAYLASQQNTLVQLEDGTRVWLNKHARLTYPEKFATDTRVVALEGEAYFEVAEDKKKPFLVKSQGTTTRVLGTSFQVSALANSNNVSVLVTSGRVSFKDNRSEAILIPGDIGTLNKSTHKLTKTIATDFNALAWHTHELRFEKTAIKEVISALNQVYEVNIETASTDLLKCRVTAHYKNESLDTILQELTLALNFKVIYENNKIIFDGKACY